MRLATGLRGIAILALSLRRGRGVIEPVAGRPTQIQRLPDGRTTLVFRVIEEGRRGDLSALGPAHAGRLFKTTTGIVRALVLQFKPGWSVPLLGVAASALTDRIVLLEDLWGSSGGDLCHGLLEAQSVAEVLDRLAEAIALRAQETSEPASGRLARDAVRLPRGRRGPDGERRRATGVTGRHLRRAFMESVGIGPQEFARTVRLQRAVRSAATSNDWARIAAEAGYYDQSHLIADFRELVGLTPGAFVKRAGNRRI